VLSTNSLCFPPRFNIHTNHVGNSGIGLSAAKLLALNNPLHRIVMACRTQESADLARKEVLAHLPDDEYYRENIIALACDHTSFDSLRQFNDVLRLRLDETYNTNKWIQNGIDVLCLNAATLVPKDSDPQFTNDEFELTFQTNYLAPFLILHLIMDRINTGARIVLSTSGLYDRVEFKNFNGMKDSSTGRIRKRFAMIDDSPFHYKTCYSISKLCIVALCAELERRIPKKRHITINCFSPGLMTTSGLFRNQCYLNNDEITMHNKHVLLKEKTVGWGAGALVFMAIGQETGIRNSEYWRDADSTLGWDSQYGLHFCPINIENQIDLESRKELWRLSCEMVGISSDESALT
jgi:protochlorophyllide reductase